MTDRRSRTKGSGTPELPAYQDVLSGTNWASLTTPWGTGEALPELLVQMLSPDPAVQSAAIGKTLGEVSHQNTIYAATAPVALYVASILRHPAIGADDAHVPPHGSPLVRLLEWLSDAAYDADDTCVAIGERHWGETYLDDYAEMRQFRDLRPILFSAVRPLLRHESAHVRDAALVAAIPLSEHPALSRPRAELTTHARRLLASSTDRHHRDRTFDAMKAWGQGTRHLENADDVLSRVRRARARTRFGDPWMPKEAGTYCEAPPF